MYSITTDYTDGLKYLVKLTKKDVENPHHLQSSLSNDELIDRERFIPIENLFPLINTAHLETKHGKRDTLMKKLREMKVANAGRDTVLQFLSLCDVCVKERENCQ